MIPTIGDQFADLTVIATSYTHHDWGSLWAQHNENRILFPNLIVIVLAHTTAFNVQVEEYLSAIFLVASTAMLVLSHKRRSDSPWLYYVPIAFLALSIVQAENMLWGFQMAWCLVVLCLAATIYLVDRPVLTWPVMTAGIATAVIGSFSSLQGLLIWAAGFVLLWHRKRAAAFLWTWVGAAAVTTAVYLHHFNRHAGSGPQGLLWHYPLQALKYYLFELGDIIGAPYHAGETGPIVFLGGAILALAVWTLALYGFRRDPGGPGPIGIALIVVGLVFAVVVMVGRLYLGYASASQSRYTTFDLLVPIGIYLTFLSRPVITAKRIVVPLLTAVITVQVVIGIPFGIERGRQHNAYDMTAVHILRNIDHEPPLTIDFVLYPFVSPSWIEGQVRIAKEHHLSLFADP